MFPPELVYGTTGSKRRGDFCPSRGGVDGSRRRPRPHIATKTAVANAHGVDLVLLSKTIEVLVYKRPVIGGVGLDHSCDAPE